MALVKEDVCQLLAQLESFGKVEKVGLDRPVRTTIRQLRQELPTARCHCRSPLATSTLVRLVALRFVATRLLIRAAK